MSRRGASISSRTSSLATEPEYGRPPDSLLPPHPVHSPGRMEEPHQEYPNRTLPPPDQSIRRGMLHNTLGDHDPGLTPSSSLIVTNVAQPSVAPLTSYVRSKALKDLIFPHCRTRHPTSTPSRPSSTQPLPLVWTNYWKRHGSQNMLSNTWSTIWPS